MKQRIWFWAALALILVPAGAAQAADTIETFDVGATDLEFYSGYDGIGLDKYDGVVAGELVLGLGLIDGLSATLGVSAEANERLGAGAGAVGFGLFGTPVDTDHFDLDLSWGMEISGSDFSLAPGIEMNFDLKPDLALWGMYVRINPTLTGRDESSEDDPATLAVDESKPKFAFAPGMGMTLGTYWTIAEKHQLLLEADTTLLFDPADDERTFDFGGVALGYNVMVHPSVELITQVYLDIPQEDDKFSVGVMGGIVVTLPSPAAAASEEKPE